MAIQFNCVSCGRAIEIDEQWAHRVVECPFCHDTVRAPGISTLRTAETPVAAPVTAAPAPEEVWMAPGGIEVPQGGPRNTLAIVALVLTFAAVVLLLWTSISVAGMIQSRLGNEPNVAEVQKMMQDAMQNQEPWAVKLGFSFLGAFGLWVAGSVCALVAVTRPGRKGVAVAALAVAGLPVLLIVLRMLAAG